MGVPIGTSVVASSGIVAAANAVATLPAVLGKTNHISGFEMTAAGATGAALVGATVVGTLGGTLTYVFSAPAGATLPAPSLIVYFDPPLPASAPNVAIVVTLPSLGAGNTAACVVAHGFLTPPA